MRKKWMNSYAKFGGATRRHVSAICEKPMGGGTYVSPPGRARVNWRSYRRENFTQYALAGDLSNGVGRDPVKNLVRLVLAKYFLR